MAMGKPLISGDSPAVRQVFTHGEHIYLCQRANGQAIAEAIRTLLNNPGIRDHIARNGFLVFKECYNLLNNGKRCEIYLRELVE
jgi:glycosyltransferase involved in cell wall biosynthesis